LVNLASNFADQVGVEIQHFLDTELAASNERLSALDNTDLALAEEIANKYLTRRLRSQLRETSTTASTSGNTNPGFTLKTNPKTHPKETANAEINKLTANLVSVSLEHAQKGKRKAIISPEGVHTSHEPSTDEDITCVVSDSEMEYEVTGEKPDAKRQRPSHQYLQKSPGVFVFTGNKDEWHIQPTDSQKIVVLADSNMRLANAPPNMELFVLPGAHIRHATRALARWRPTNAMERRTVVLQVGINNRCIHQDALDVEIKELWDTLNKMPHIQRMIVMGVSYPDTLSPSEKRNLLHLNQRLFDRFGDENYIEPMDPQEVEIEPNDVYGIHYTASTRQRIVTSIATVVSKHHV
jgi:hypothetical protein